MSRRILTVLAAVVTLFGAGCSSMSNTGKGALAGGGIGAVTGALVDRATGGKGGAGAIVGGAAGALVGGAIGNEEDQREKAALQARADATARQIGVEEVKQMAHQGLSEELIINQIRTTGSSYTLSAEDLRMLRENNVSDRVIMEMQNRRADAHPRMRYVHVPPPAPVYVVGPPPPPVFVVPAPPPQAFGVGVSIRR